MRHEFDVRPLRASDAANVLEAFRSAGDMARQGQVSSQAEADAYLHHLCGAHSEHHAYAVTDEDTLIGLVAVNVDGANKLGWFWYWMNASHRRRGWMRKAAPAVANWALSEGRLERLELGHRANNPESGKVARAAGFVQEGVERQNFIVGGRRVDVLVYGRLATDPWPPNDLSVHPR